MIGDINTLFSVKDNNVEDLKDIINSVDSMDLINKYLTIHPDKREYNFSNIHGTFTIVDHTLVQKDNFGNFTK